MTIAFNSSIQTYLLGQTSTADSWLISDWAAGQSSLVRWDPTNVRRAADGAVELVLDRAAAGSSRPYDGAEIQSKEVATTGTWTWVAQAPVMQSGAVFGMFTYKADWKTQPWVEFDFEFVGRDTTKVQLNIHMEDASGRHISLDQAKGGPIIVNLGFDAAKGQHTYEVSVSDTTAVFRVDGKIVGSYGAKDMPGGVWQIGPQKSFVDLWAVDAGQESWAGDWAYNGTPITAKFSGFDIRPGDLTPSVIDTTTPTDPVIDTPVPADIQGDDGNNVLTGNDADNTIQGAGGDDTLSGGAGNDSLYGGAGNDTFLSGGGDDLKDGGAGSDWLSFGGSAAATVNLSLSGAQATGYGNDIVLNIENIFGTGAADRLTGNDLDNILIGNGGSDTLSGAAGNDLIDGGAGDDSLAGGTGNDTLLGGDGNDRMTLSPGDDRIDGGTGLDWLLITDSSGAQIDLGRSTAQDTGHGMDTITGIDNLQGGAGNDRLRGHDGANILKGGAGQDVLDGAAGADSLTGGAGADLLSGGIDSARDVFIFNALSDSRTATGRDTIQDFRSGIDDIDLRAIDARSTRGGDQAFAFNGTTAAAHSVWYETDGTNLIVHGDTNGDRIADFDIAFNSVTSLNAGDFLL